MDIFLYLLITTVDIILSVIMFAMFARAVLSFIPIDSTGTFTAFLLMITEPVIFPVRWIFDKLGVGVGFPLDIPFFVTYIILSFISVLL